MRSGGKPGILNSKKGDAFILEWILRWDNALLDWIQTLRTPFGDWLMPAVSSLGNAGLMWIALCAALLCFRKTRRAGVAMAAALLVNLAACNLVLKPLVGRIRPFEANAFTGLLIAPPGDPSFPSGHTAASFAAAAALWRYHRKGGAAAFALAGLMGLSRLYLYVHYPSDVLAGALTGAAAAWLGVWVEHWLYRRRSDRGNIAKT